MKKIKNEIKPLSNVEWDTCWMAVRYAIGRQSIACTMLPRDLIKEYWYRWSIHQKQMLVKEVERYEEESKRLYDKSYSSWVENNIDRPVWIKFMNALDEHNHKMAKLKDGTEYRVFFVGEITYTLDDYIKNPYSEVYIDKADINEYI